MADEKQKMFRVYSIVERPKQDDYWLNIGVAFAHSVDKGVGYNVILQALPLPGKDGQCKLVIREYDPEKAEQKSDKK